MKRIVVLLFLAACLLSVRAQSRDELIEAYRQGTLTQEQIERLKRQYGLMGGVDDDIKTIEPSRVRTLNSREDTSASSQRPNLIATPKVNNGDAVIVDNFEQTKKGVGRPIFGHEIFRGKVHSLDPNLNIATPTNYVLGPADEIIIDLWGDSQQTLRAELTPEGYVVLQNVGPVFVAGLTIKEAERRLKRAMSNLYDGLNDGSVKMMLSLGRIRSIRVGVLGEVLMPGTYVLPSLATLLDALYAAGGVSGIGSLRTIRLYRNGRQLAEVDGYEYILSGRNDWNITLQDGDRIVVPPYCSLVNITGAVKRPMLYEMCEGEHLSDLLRFAGNFSGEANRQWVSVVRQQGGKYETHTINREDFDDFAIIDGDSIIVGGSINRHANRVEVRGAVYREGFYATDDKVQTVTDLIRQADGLREDAFMTRASLYREGKDLMPELVSIDLNALLSGEIEDIILRPNDMLVVSSVEDVTENYSVAIYGAVGRSGHYPYADNMSVEDLIVKAGGLRESASTANVIVTRRIKNPTSLTAQEKLFEMFTIDISDDLAITGREFVLQPFDQVFVRRSPVYITQSSVTVEGEVAFAGKYPLLYRDMRLSDIISEAGLPTPGAFVEGAYLLRKMTSEERAQRDALQSLINMQKGEGQDSLEMVGMNLSSVYPVGINLAEALAHPGSDADVVLRDGDLIAVPKYNGTVRVMGNVLYPNSVTYKVGRSLRYYIDAAGGFGTRARKQRTFVIYMNGMVASGLSTKIRPGCVVVVPSKTPAQPLLWSDIVGLLSTSTSTAAVVMSAINLINK